MQIKARQCSEAFPFLGEVPSPGVGRWGQAPGALGVAEDVGLTFLEVGQDLACSVPHSRWVEVKYGLTR